MLELVPLRQLLVHLVSTVTRSEGMYRLNALRHALREVRWREPVDAIYAVLDLVPESEKALAIRPDYTRPVASVFTEVAVKLLQVNKDANFLATCELSSKSLPDLPSWVPDWSSQIDLIDLQSQWTSARISPHFNLEEDKTLAIAAVRKGEVDVSYLAPPQFGHRIVFYILRTLPKDLSQPYVGGGDLCRAYAEAFVAGLTSERSSSTKHTSRAAAERFLRVLQDVKDPMGPTRDAP